MPTYEYLCSAGHDFEQLQRMSDPPVSECPRCGAPAERQLSAGAGLLFKGSGFYITDYRSDSYRKAAEADSGGRSPAAEAKDGTSKDSSTKDASSKEASSKDSAAGGSASKGSESAAPKKASAPKKESGGAATPRGDG